MPPLPKNDKPIDITQIAQALGVSKTTVSRAISGNGRISAATRQRVLDYVKEHNYPPRRRSPVYHRRNPPPSHPSAPSYIHS